MTDAERLQEVKKSAKWLHCFAGPVDVKSISEDMNWLIEQAEECLERHALNVKHVRALRDIRKTIMNHYPNDILLEIYDKVNEALEESK